MRTYFENNIAKIYISHKKESYYFESHFHNKLEIAYCVSGFQNIKIGNTLYTLKKGDAVIIFPNVVHEYIKYDAEPQAETECIALISETDFFTGIIPDLITKRPKTPFINAELISADSALAFEKMTTAEGETELLGWTLIALSSIVKSLHLIPVKESDGFSLAPNLISYINANFQKPLTIKYLGKEFGYSTSYIAHIFYDQLKIPFRTYLGAVRSEYAANLISTTNKSLTEIAYECGYNSLNTFCRCFKKHFSKTPSEYKKTSDRGCA
ncbi:MAG: helix-turn-helix transcriptional regulator [Clostridia bacterium]|nr:helix-turn-helix transcriptional regulator [Clostridia bacterium]